MLEQDLHIGHSAGASSLQESRPTHSSLPGLCVALGAQEAVSFSLLQWLYGSHAVYRMNLEHGIELALVLGQKHHLHLLCRSGDYIYSVTVLFWVSRLGESHSRSMGQKHWLVCSCMY